MNTVNEESLSHPKLVVGIGTHDFRVACLSAMPHAARLQLLGDAKTLRSQPSWIGAAMAVGTFKMNEPKGEIGHRARLVRGEHEAIAKVVEALLSREGLEPAEHLRADPVNGDPLSKAMGSMNPPELNGPMKAAYAALVAHVIAQAPASAAEPEVFKLTSSPKKRRAGSASPALVVPTDDFAINTALLLTVACATGDVDRAQDIARACPSSLRVPVSDAWTGSSLITSDLYAPPLVAAACNRVPVLEALRDCGWDPLGPSMWSPSFNKVSRDLTDPNAKGRTLSDFLTMADHGTSILDGVWPRTAEIFLREASLRCASAGASGDPTPLTPEQRNRFLTIARGAISGKDRKEWLVALGRTGAFARQADDLVHAAVERVNSIWRRPESIVTESAWKSQIAFLDRFLKHIDWALHRGSSFLIDRALERDNGHGALALHLAQRCVQAGRADQITAPHEVHETNGADFNPLHKWASAGRTALAVYAIEQGANPLGLWIGATPIAAAEANGHADTANAIRSIVARRTAQAAIDSMDMDRADSLSFPRPAGRRAP